MNDLSETEITLIKLMSLGFTNKEIADCFYKATEKTIDKQRSRLFKKVGVKNGPHLISWAYKNKVLN